MNKVRCKKLAAVSAAIHLSIQSNSNYSYNDALKVYKATVAKSGTANQNINDRQVREQNQGRGGQGFVSGFGRGYSSESGRDGRGYSGRGKYQQQVPKTVGGSRFLNLRVGTRIEYHLSIAYPPEVLSKFSSEEKDMLEHDWANGTVPQVPARGGYGGSRGYNSGGRGSYGSGQGGYSNKQKIQQLEQQVWDQQSQSQVYRQSQQSDQVPDQVDTGSQSKKGDTRSRISQVTIQEGSIMRGRSDQAR